MYRNFGVAPYRNHTSRLSTRCVHRLSMVCPSDCALRTVMSEPKADVPRPSEVRQVPSSALYRVTGSRGAAESKQSPSVVFEGAMLQPPESPQRGWKLDLDRRLCAAEGVQEGVDAEGRGNFEASFAADNESQHRTARETGPSSETHQRPSRCSP